MGPWQFCFDLKTRDVPDCLGDSTKKNLSLGFFTFADGEVGAWTGTASVCRLDHPLKLTLKAKCGRISNSDVEYLDPLCSGDVLEYHIEEPDISHWDWNISPFWAAPYLQNQGPNGFTITAPLVNETGKPVNITGILIGHQEGTPDKIIRKFTFKLKDTETCGLVSENSPQGSLNKNAGQIRIYPMPADEMAILEWSFELQKEAAVDIYNSQGVRVDKIFVSQNEGNQNRIVTQNLLPGIYYISFGNADFRHVTKLVKL
jgi:hypothetical protein